MKCPYCRYALAPGAKVCGQCGRAIDAPDYFACGKCGVEVPRQAAGQPCPRCGTLLQQAADLPAPSLPVAAPLQRVVVTAIDLPFGELVGFFIKCGLAAVPAAIVVAVVWFFVSAFLAGAMMGVTR